jgi:hypothetical protein
MSRGNVCAETTLCDLSVQASVLCGSAVSEARISLGLSIRSNHEMGKRSNAKRKSSRRGEMVIKEVWAESRDSRKVRKDHAYRTL